MDSSQSSFESKRSGDDESESGYSVSELFKRDSKKVEVVRKSLNHLHDAPTSRSSVVLFQDYALTDSLRNSFVEDGSSLTDDTLSRIKSFRIRQSCSYPPR